MRRFVAGIESRCGPRSDHSGITPATLSRVTTCSCEVRSSASSSRSIAGRFERPRSSDISTATTVTSASGATVRAATSAASESRPPENETAYASTPSRRARVAAVKCLPRSAGAARAGHGESVSGAGASAHGEHGTNSPTMDACESQSASRSSEIERRCRSTPTGAAEEASRPSGGSAVAQAARRTGDDHTGRPL